MKSIEKQFTEEQVIRILKEYKGGERAMDIARRNEIVKQTFRYWKKKYSEMNLKKTKRLKQLEEENRRLKEIVADLSLDNKILKNEKINDR